MLEVMFDTIGYLFLCENLLIIPIANSCSDLVNVAYHITIADTMIDMGIDTRNRQGICMKWVNNSPVTINEIAGRASGLCTLLMKCMMESPAVYLSIGRRMMAQSASIDT